MFKTIAPKDMKRVEARAIGEGRVTGEALMQRAAALSARAAARRAAGRGGAVLCLCGCGNNGGDGLAAMRILAAGDEHFTGECWILPGELSPDARREADRLAPYAERVRLRWLAETDRPTFPDTLACIIDALFGTGLSRPLTGLAAALCEAANTAAAGGVPVVAVDIPSGLNGETGHVMGTAIRATETITFHRPKPGLYLGQGPDCAGTITVAPIGLNPEWDDADGMAVLASGEPLLPARSRVSHKGSYGRVLLLVGGRGMAGAAAISALAALRTGAGLVTVACPESVMAAVQVLCPCATCIPLPQNDAPAAFKALAEALSRADALGMGCGLGTDEATGELLRLILTDLNRNELPMLLDADALNLLTGMKDVPRLERALITPHPGEAARLLHCKTEDITGDAVNAALRLHERFGCAVVLKGACSVLCSAEGLALNPFGTPAMAKGGSGDALTGVLTALLAGRRAGAYGLSDLRLMQVGCALHGLAGELAETKWGERGVLATDLCDCLGLVGQGQPNALMDASTVHSPLGQIVAVTVDRKLGTRHPKHRDIVYGLNYGYVQQVLAADNEWQDAYIYGVSEPVEWFEGEVIAIVHRLNDAEDKWVVAAPGTRAGKDEIARAVAFQERYFETDIEALS